MREVHKNLFVGNLDDYTSSQFNNSGFYYVSCCKDPVHREVVGYEGNLEPDHPEYLYAIRENQIALNIVDSDNPKYFSERQIIKALQAINFRIDRPVLVHCNRGESRSPSIAMLYLATKRLIDYRTYGTAETEFRRLYPAFNPSAGISRFLFVNWKKFCY